MTEMQPSRRQQPQSFYQSQPYCQPQSPLEAEQEDVILLAYGSKGSLVGQASANLEAYLTDCNGQGIRGLFIEFFVKGSNTFIGGTSTDDHGIARVGSSSNISYPLLCLQALASGFYVKSAGNEKYHSATG